jgi:hypothetical protein
MSAHSRALKILEAAILDCKARDIDTPEVRQALDVLEPYCEPQWRVTGFRAHLKASEQQFGPDGEGQQQGLRAYFGGIPGNVKALLASNSENFDIVIVKRMTLR